MNSSRNEAVVSREYANDMIKLPWLFYKCMGAYGHGWHWDVREPCAPTRGKFWDKI